MQYEALHFLVHAIFVLQQITGGTVVSTVALQQEGPGYDSGSGCFCVEFACSPFVCASSFQVLRLPPKVQKHAKLRIRLNGNSELPIGVTVDGCFICMSTCCDELVQGVPRLLPKMLR